MKKLLIGLCAMAAAATLGSAQAADVDGHTLTVADKDLSFKVDSNGNPMEDTFFYAGVVKTFDLFSN